MAAAVKTTVTELPASRVRVEVEVPPEEVSRALEVAASRIGRDLKLAGFRKGKVPAPVVIGRMGREAVLDEAVRERLGRWYSAAIGASRIVAVGEPELALGDLPGGARAVHVLDRDRRATAGDARGVARDRGAAARAGGR